MPYLLVLVTILVAGAVYAMYNSKNTSAERDEGQKGFNYIDHLISEHEEHQDMLSQRAMLNNEDVHIRVHDIRITQFSTPFPKKGGVYEFVAPHVAKKTVQNYLEIMCKRNEWTFRVTENEFEGVVIEINTYVSCAIC